MSRPKLIVVSSQLLGHVKCSVHKCKQALFTQLNAHALPMLQACIYGILLRDRDLIEHEKRN